MVFLLAFHLRAPMRASYSKAAREDGVAIQPSLVQPALESIRFDALRELESKPNSNTVKEQMITIGVSITPNTIHL
jgi:hypothetical protein